MAQGQPRAQSGLPPKRSLPCAAPPAPPAVLGCSPHPIQPLGTTGFVPATFLTSSVAPVWHRREVGLERHRCCGAPLSSSHAHP
eukprot:4109623-Prymnesium_polylepis.1